MRRSGYRFRHDEVHPQQCGDRAEITDHRCPSFAASPTAFLHLLFRFAGCVGGRNFGMYVVYTHTAQCTKYAELTRVMARRRRRVRTTHAVILSAACPIEASCSLKVGRTTPPPFFDASFARETRCRIPRGVRPLLPTEPLGKPKRLRGPLVSAFVLGVDDSSRRLGDVCLRRGLMPTARWHSSVSGPFPLSTGAAPSTLLWPVRLLRVFLLP